MNLVPSPRAQVHSSEPECCSIVVRAVVASVIGMSDFGEEPPDQLVFPVSKHLGEGWIHLYPAAISVGERHRDRSIHEHPLKPLMLVGELGACGPECARHERQPGRKQQQQKSGCTHENRVVRTPLSLRDRVRENRCKQTESEQDARLPESSRNQYAKPPHRPCDRTLSGLFEGRRAILYGLAPA